jgi:predicted AlkP superfamily phosphohydrolase/phosphomutase
MKTIVIGLDGASFELIDPWISDGKLPNIARIKQHGVWADMRSVLPPVTSPNWKCYSTGKNPGKVGIFWWENIDWENRKVYYPAARKFENKELWDYIGEAGMKVGVLGMPTTYPPKKVNGFLISGGPDAEDINFTYPPELEKDLKGQAWRNHPQSMIEIDREKTCREIHEIIDIHFKTVAILAQKYEVDFLMVALFYTNNLQHFLWNSPETKKAWELIDRHVGKFMNQGCDLMLMSDHGSNEIERVFNINTWLKEEGYLNLRANPGAILYKLGINQHILANLASKLRMLGLLKKVVPKTIYRNIPTEAGEVDMEFKTGKINWLKSKALASGQGPIYLNPESNNVGVLREEIKQKLETLLVPSTGARIVERVYTKEELYHGKYLTEAPDLIIDQAKGVHISGGIGQKSVFDSPRRWQAENKKLGLFMAYGPNIKRGDKIDNVSIIDLAPTILHLMAVPVPEDMDGRVLKEIFREGSEPAEREVKFVQVKKSESERVKKKVRDLRKQAKI